MPRPLSRFASLFAMILALAALGARADDDKAWSITQLPGVGGVNGADAMAVNDRGDIVGQTLMPNGHVTLWRNGVAQDLGPGEAFDVNAHGDIAAVHFPGGESLWKDGTWTVLGAGTPGFPLFLNDHDVVASSFPFTGVQHAFTFRDGVVMDLGTLGGTESQAAGINDRGDVVGFSRTAGDAAIHPFLLRNGAMKDLGTLGRVQGKATSVNNRGVVVGYVSDLFDGRPMGFIFDGVMRPLVPGLSCCMFPSAINDRGAVVGTINGLGAFLLQDGVLTRLDQLPVVKAAGWTQLLPTGINDRGWIVGRGLMNKPVAPGEYPFRAFVLKRGGEGHDDD